MSFESVIDTLEIRNANKISFVGTSSSFIDTTTGRIQTKGIQHNSNVITDVSGPHGRGVATLKKYPEIAFGKGKFDITEIVAGSDQYWDGPSTVFQGGYSLKTTNHSTDSGGKFGWMAFDGNSETFWKNIEEYDTSGNYDYGYTGIQQRLTDTNSTNHDGDHVIMGSPNALKMAKVTVTCKDSDRRVVNYSVLGSNSSGATGWTLLDSGTFTAQNVNTATISSPTSYFKYHAFVVRTVTASANGMRFQINSIDFYGYEEDPPAGDHSVDTTFKSRFNNAQTTGVQVLVDGNAGQLGANQISGGPDPSGNQSTYVTDGKYWTLNGTLTSNLSVEANTFLEGDQPHAVSVWFNSSNLEANVSNTCVFSVSDQEKLDSVNLDLQSNTWHNLTYAYQGEGGSRVTYLDGRKVAEDQAEDTFGDYPPFAMTGYSQGGYVASASNEENTDRTAYTLFNDVESEGNGWRDTGGTFQAGTGGHYRSDGTYDPATGIPRANLGSDSGGTAFATADEGEWVKIELPYKIKLNYFTLQPRNSTNIANGSNPSLSWGRSEFIKNGKIWGSNDGINWSVVHTISGTSASSDTVINSYTVGSSVAYKYFAIVITATNTSTDYASSTSLSEWKLYGHRENDLVRLPDPTRVLKYPHVNFINIDVPETGNGWGSNVSPAIRGYIASSEGQNPAYPAGKVFDGILWSSTTGQQRWQPQNANYPSDGTVATTTGQSTTIPGSTPNPVRGDYIQLESPHKLIITKFKIFCGPTGSGVDIYRPTRARIVGSNTNNGTDWVDLGGGDITLPTYVTENGNLVTTASISNTNAYKYHRLIVRSVANGQSIPVIYQLELYGTGVDSIPIQIGGGNIDKVANFRVYDRFIEEDQALEIWDAQKEEFGRAKPQMVLQQGKLGIGTDAPQGSLSVADEPHNLEEFPPRAMTGDETYMEGHGEFCASASTWYNQAISSSPIYPWNAFNKGALGFSTSNGHANNWEASSADYSASTGLYTGSVNTAGINGDWVQLELPYAIKLDYMELMPMYYNDGTHPNIGPARSPQDGHIMASNDGVNWISIYNWTGRTDFTTLEYTRFKVPGTVTKAYKYFRIVWTRTNYTAPDGGSYSGYASGGEIKFFGTREQGQSVLHDGQLTLAKNLTVPRIGPAIDENDNTPRRDRLIVEYNTSTNPTFEGIVRDTSMGKKFDARIIGNAHYNATIKTFEGFGVSNPIDANGDYLRTDISTFRGNVAHSHSVWIRMYNDAGIWTTAINLGANDTSNQSAVTWNMGDDRLWWNTYSGGIFVSHKPQFGRWYHIVTTHNGQGATTNSTSCIYIDGVKQSTTDGTSGINGTGGTLNIAGDYLTIGAARSNNDGKIRNHFNGQIASYKLYDIVLTPQEVKDLYDMGHCEEGNNVINIEKSRVGIGLGDGMSPHEELDVRGDIRASDNLIIGPYGEHWWKLWTFQHNGNLGFIGEDGTEHGYLVDSGTVNNIDFTGQHRSIVDKINVSDYENLEGLIVSANKNKYVNVDKDITTGSNAIQISQSLPVVSLSNVVHDKACYGVIAGSEDPESRTYEQGTFVSVFQKQKGDTRAFINSVGEGAIWVVNTNGSLESGDYITTSNVAGYGQKQDDDVLHNYTVAKITMDCDFEPATQPVQQILRSNVVQTYYLGDVHHVKSMPYEIITTEEGESNVVYDTKYTLTTTANVTESDPWDNVFIDPPEVTYTEYSNLEANVQSTYTLTFTQTTTDEKTPTEWLALESNVQSLYNKVYYQSVEEEVAADYPGAVAHTRVTDQVENTLDEYGQIQWEDHPTETEKAYKVRYLTADGTQTDEANAVHIAAFVGCTYHCG